MNYNLKIEQLVPKKQQLLSKDNPTMNNNKNRRNIIPGKVDSQRRAEIIIINIRDELNEIKDEQVCWKIN